MCRLVLFLPIPAWTLRDCLIEALGVLAQPMVPPLNKEIVMTNWKLNVAVLAQIIGIALIITATPVKLFLGIAAFIIGALVYRREKQAIAIASANKIPERSNA